MYCNNCSVDIYKYEIKAICMKCNFTYCLNCEHYNEGDLYYIDDDNDVYKKKCCNCINQKIK